MCYAVKPCPCLAGVRAGLRQGYTKLIKLDFTRKLAIDPYNDVLRRFEILHGLEGIGRLLAKLVYSLLQPIAGTAGRFKFCLQLILDVGLGESIGNPRRLDWIQRGISDFFVVAAAQTDHPQIVCEGANGTSASGRLATARHPVHQPI